MTDAQFLFVVTGGRVCPGLQDLRESIAFCKVIINGRLREVAIGLETDKPDKPILRISSPK